MTSEIDYMNRLKRSAAEGIPEVPIYAMPLKARLQNGDFFRENGRPMLFLKVEDLVKAVDDFVAQTAATVKRGSMNSAYGDRDIEVVGYDGQVYSMESVRKARVPGHGKAEGASLQSTSVEVVVPVKCSVAGATPERIRAIVEKLLAVGIADAIATLEDKEGDLADAQFAADLEIGEARLAKAPANVKLSKGVSSKVPGTFRVPVHVTVEADSLEEATEEVHGLMDYAFEVSNDEGRFKEFEVESSEPAKFAVIGYYEENGQVFCDHVTASDPFNAIAKSAAEREGDPAYVGALPVEDTSRLEYAGEGVVFAETVREQSDVFPLDDDSPSCRM